MNGLVLDLPASAGPSGATTCAGSRAIRSRAQVSPEDTSAGTSHSRVALPAPRATSTWARSALSNLPSWRKSIQPARVAPAGPGLTGTVTS